MGSVTSLDAGSWSPQQALLAAQEMVDDIESVVIVVRSKGDLGGGSVMVTSKQTKEALLYAGALVQREAMDG